MPVNEARRNNLFNILYLLLTGLLFVSGVLGGHFSSINSISMIALLLLWIAEGQFQEKWQRAKNSPLIWFTSLYFLLYVLSIAVSADHARATDLVLRELPLFMLPLIFSTKIPFSKDAIYALLKWLVYITTAWMSIATIMALQKYLATGDIYVFLYHPLAYNVESSAIFASMVCIICVAVIFFVPASPRWKVIFYTCFTIWLILLSSRMFIFIHLLISAVNLFTILPKKYRAPVMAGIIAIVVLFTLTDNPVKNRFQDLEKFQTNYLTRPKFATDIYFDGLSLRLVYIRYSMEIMHEHHGYLTGVGTGNAATLLRDKIRLYHMNIGDGSITEKGGYLQYSFHNVYLESLVSLGIPGLISLLLLYGYIVGVGLRRHMPLLRDMGVIIILSSFTDVIAINEQCDVSLLFTICCLAIALYKWPQNAPGIAG